MKKFFVMLALAWGTVGAFAQNEADSVAAVNNAITLAKDCLLYTSLPEATRKSCRASC